MAQRLIGKLKVTKVANPIGGGNSYYADGGPEGVVLIWNSSDLPVHLLAALEAWELEPPEDGVPTPDALKPKFDSKGWAL